VIHKNLEGGPWVELEHLALLLIKEDVPSLKEVDVTRLCDLIWQITIRIVTSQASSEHQSIVRARTNPSR
jgi:hypothetical protein